MKVSFFMKLPISLLGLALALWGAFVGAAGAEQPRGGTVVEERVTVEELTKRVEILSEEVESLREGREGVREKIRFHGYGELHYNDPNKGGEKAKLDFHRMVIGLSYHFNDWINLDVEVDFEHAAKEMELEFAYLNFLVSDAINFRVGGVLMPMGYLNEFHEPPLFYSVERPYVQKNIIPTSWQEGGVGLFGSPHRTFRYRLYVVGGLDASKFKPSDGIRGGRGKIAEALAEDIAVVGRGEFIGVPGLQVGFSFYQGNASQNDPNLGDASVGIYEGDVKYTWKGFEVIGLYAQVNLDDTDKIAAKTGKVLGRRMPGWYLEGAYHVGKLFLPREHDLVAFVRHEEFNTQKDVVPTLTADPKNDRKVTTFGLAYFPHSRIAIKADLESWEDGTEDSWSQFNLGIAYMF